MNVHSPLYCSSSRRGRGDPGNDRGPLDHPWCLVNKSEVLLSRGVRSQGDADGNDGSASIEWRKYMEV
jgi:hypothetical protein